ncbi:MAG: hypothetical protein ACJ73S_15860 [Mycobacteriales bacterium]
MADPQIVADIPKITKLGIHSTDLANHVSGLADRNPEIKTPPAFGEKAGGGAFLEAATMARAYLNQVEKFAGQNSNLTDLANQFTLMKTGTDKIVSDYNAGILSEANAADEFRNAMGGSGTAGA